MFRAMQLRRNGFNKVKKVGGVLLVHHFQLTVQNQAFERIFAQRFGYGKTRFAIRGFYRTQ